MMFRAGALLLSLAFAGAPSVADYCAVSCETAHIGDAAASSRTPVIIIIRRRLSTALHSIGQAPQPCGHDHNASRPSQHPLMPRARGCSRPPAPPCCLRLFRPHRSGRRSPTSTARILRRAPRFAASPLPFESRADLVQLQAGSFRTRHDGGHRMWGPRTRPTSIAQARGGGSPACYVSTVGEAHDSVSAPGGAFGSMLHGRVLFVERDGNRAGRDSHTKRTRAGDRRRLAVHAGRHRLRRVQPARRSSRRQGVRRAELVDGHGGPKRRQRHGDVHQYVQPRGRHASARTAIARSFRPGKRSTALR